MPSKICSARCPGCGATLAVKIFSDGRVVVLDGEVALAERKADLERAIRESYNVIREYESIITFSDRPEEKGRARGQIDECWERIRTYREQYRRLGISPPDDIAGIFAHFLF